MADDTELTPELKDELIQLVIDEASKYEGSPAGLANRIIERIEKL